jgi:hypothetical protein
VGENDGTYFWMFEFHARKDFEDVGIGGRTGTRRYAVVHPDRTVEFAQKGGTPRKKMKFEPVDTDNQITRP